MKAKRNNKADIKTNNKIKTKNSKVKSSKLPKKKKTKYSAKRNLKPKTVYDYKTFAIRKPMFSHGSLLINIPKSYGETLKFANSSVKIRMVGLKLVLTRVD